MAASMSSTMTQVMAKAQVLADEQRGLSREEAAELLARTCHQIRTDLEHAMRSHWGVLPSTAREVLEER